MNEEFEPNGELANANLPSSATRSTPDQTVGWLVAGSINDVSDITDAYAFTPNQTRDYYLLLCPPQGSTCSDNSGIDTLTAFSRVLDQDGNVLLTSEADTDDGNSHHTTLDAGVLYSDRRYRGYDACDGQLSTVGLPNTVIGGRPSFEIPEPRNRMASPRGHFFWANLSTTHSSATEETKN